MEAERAIPGAAGGPRSAGGLTGNLLREILRTPPLKEIALLHLTGIEPDNGSALVEGLLWEDPSITLGLIGSAPRMANWALELLIELGRQLDDLPAPLLKQVLGIAGRELDRDRLKELGAVYGRLLRGLVLEDVAGDADRLDAEALGRMLDRLLVLYNKAHRSRRTAVTDRLRAVLSQLDRREAISAAGGFVRTAAGVAWTLLAWAFKGTRARPRDKRAG